MNQPKGIGVPMTNEERDWVKHAARLAHQTVSDFIRQAINERLLRMGVDAVLLREDTRG